MRTRNSGISQQLQEAKQEITKQEGPCLTLQDIASIISMYQTADYSESTIKSNIRKALKGSSINVTKKGHKFNLYPADEVVRYLENLETNQKIYFDDSIEDLVGSKTLEY